jgi:hypothetical protein
LGPPPPPRVPGREMGHRAATAEPSIRRRRRQMRPREAPAPAPAPAAAQGCRGPEAAVKSGTRRDHPTPSTSGGPCPSRLRPQTPAWTNDALASPGMSRAVCMMDLVHLTMSKVSRKWFSHCLVIFHRHSLVIYLFSFSAHANSLWHQLWVLDVTA